jgi:predicted transcriptional regulator
MKASDELKHKIHNQIDSLDDEVLEEFYGHVKNFINSKTDIDTWESLTKAQQLGIKEAIEQIDKGNSIPHKKVMSNLRQKYSDA